MCGTVHSCTILVICNCTQTAWRWLYIMAQVCHSTAYSKINKTVLETVLFTVYTWCAACYNTVYQEYHSLRKKPSAIQEQTLTWNPQGKHRRVRLRRSWRKIIDVEAAIVRKIWKVKAVVWKNSTGFALWRPCTPKWSTVRGIDLTQYQEFL